MKLLLVAWDFHGVLDAYGVDVEESLRLIQRLGGENIVVSHSEQPFIEQFLHTRLLFDLFEKIYGLHQHHGRMEHFKIAALRGHVLDYGPYAFTLMIGDTHWDMESGKSAGFTTCLYDPFHCYVEKSSDVDFVITSFDELPDLLPV
jgi:phosphoglycolate phosphatase-like HAD superfamily hydrolase